MDELKIIGREEAIFSPDIAAFSDELCQTIKNSRFLVIGGAGSIGQSVTKEIFKRDPSALHIADISENNMVELVRDIRSTQGYGNGEFKTFNKVTSHLPLAIFKSVQDKKISSKLLSYIWL